MTWRRIAPWVIGVVAILAIFIDLPRTTLGLSWLPTNVGGVEFRTVLGLDLEGGLRVTLDAGELGFASHARLPFHHQLHPPYQFRHSSPSPHEPEP